MTAHRSRATALRWLLATVAAGVGVVSVVSTVQSLRATNVRDGRRITVCVASHDLLLGERVDAGACEPITARERSIPDDIIRRADSLNDHIARVPVLSGTPITQRHLAARDRSGPDAVTPPGMRTIQLKPGDGFRPPPGAVVDVIATFTTSSDTKVARPTAVIVARHVLVVGAGQSEPTPGAPALHVVVTPDQAQRLLLAQSTGSIAVAVAPPETAAPPP